MPVQRSRGGNKRSSERDVALVQMQIEAQARNQRWHQFLCEKRDDLQARLRQQGYSHSSQDSQSSQKTPSESDLAEGNGAVPQSETTAPQGSSSRWGVPKAAPAEISAPEVAVEQVFASEDIDVKGQV